MKKPIPSTGIREIFNRIFFKRLLVRISYCSSGYQIVSRKSEYYNNHISFFSSSKFDSDTETYDSSCVIKGLIFFRFCIVFADLGNKGR